MNIRPLHDRIVVRRLDEERTSAGGIVIPDSATEDNGTWGGTSTDCQEENDDSSLPGFSIITAMAGIGIAVFSKKNDD